MRESSGKHVEITVTVHIVEVLGVVLHVVGTESCDFAERASLEVGCLIPEFAGGNIEFAIAVDVTNGNSRVARFPNDCCGPRQG